MGTIKRLALEKRAMTPHILTRALLPSSDKPTRDEVVSLIWSDVLLFTFDSKKYMYFMSLQASSKSALRLIDDIKENICWDSNNGSEVLDRWQFWGKEDISVLIWSGDFNGDQTKRFPVGFALCLGIAGAFFMEPPRFPLACGDIILIPGLQTRSVALTLGPDTVVELNDTVSSNDVPFDTQALEFGP
eukprot:gene25447-31081_t